MATNWAEYASPVGMGITLGSGLGNFIGSFAQGKAAQKSYQLQGQMAWLNAVSESQTLQYNAQKVAENAGDQEFAMYKQQKSHRASMEANLAGNGVALEGSAVDIMAEQAEVDAKNRDSLIQQSKDQQASYLLQSQQAIQEGKNAVNYYNAMGKAAKSNSILGGVNSLLGATSSFVNMGANNYQQTGYFFGAGY